MKRTKKSQEEFKAHFEQVAPLVFLIPEHLLRWMIQAHQKLEGLFSDFHPHFYVLPEDQCARLLEKESPFYFKKLHLSSQSSRLLILLAQPSPKNFSEIGIEETFLRYWGVFFQALLYREGEKLRREGSLSRPAVRAFFQWCGSEFFGEIQSVLTAEQLILRKADSFEMLFSFTSYYFYLYCFAPKDLFIYFPSLTNPSEVEKKLSELGFHFIEYLEQSRPSYSGVPEIKELLAKQELYLQELQGIRIRNQAEEYLEYFLNHPLQRAPYRAEHPYYSLYFRPFAEEKIRIFFYQDHRSSALNFNKLLNATIYHPKTLDASALLSWDRILRKDFPLRYKPAGWLQSLQILLLGPFVIENLQKNEKRKKQTQKRLLSLEAIRKRLETPLESSWKKKWGKAFQKLLYYGTGLFVFVFLLERFVRAFELSSRVCQLLADGFRLRHFSRAYQRAQYNEQQETFVLQLLEFNEAICFFEEIGGRYPLKETQAIREHLEKKYQHQLATMVDKIFANLALPEEDQIELRKLIRYLAYSARYEPLARHLLIDLQRSYMEGNQSYFWANLGAYFFSLGRIPLRAPLKFYPALKRFRRFQRALEKLLRLPLDPQQYVRYLRMMENIASRFKAQLHEEILQSLKPIFKDVFSQQMSYPEQMAQIQIQEDIIEKIVQQHYLNFMELRDLLSTHDLKIRDWSHLKDFLGYDPLSLLDRRFRREFPGIYDGAEIYLKGLHLLSGLFFGTRWGRRIAKYLLFSGGFALSVAVLLDYSTPYVYLPVSSFFATAPLVLIWSLVLFFLWTSLGRSLIYKFWKVLRFFFSLLFWTLKFFFYGVPQFLWNFFDSWIPFGFRIRFLAPFFIASFFTVLYAWLAPDTSKEILGVLFGSISLLCYMLALPWIDFKRRLRFVTVDMGIEGLKFLFISFFKGTLKFCHSFLFLSECGMYHLEQYFRHQQGEWLGKTLLKRLFAFLWFWPRFTIRFYLRVFLEPQINPLKFPVVSVTYKVWLPLSLTFTPPLESALVRLQIPFALAKGIVQFHAFIFTGSFGFLFWELKQNWGLYRQNDSCVIRKLPILPQGETLAQLLHTGISLGKIPEIYQKLRKATHSRRYSAEHSIQIRLLERKLDLLKKRIQFFTEKHFLGGLLQHPVFSNRQEFLGVSEIRLWNGGLFVSIKVGPSKEALLLLHFEMKGELLVVACQLHPEAHEILSSAQKTMIDLALYLFYKRLGVALSEEHLSAYLMQRYKTYLETLEPSQKIRFSIQKDRLILEIPLPYSSGWSEISYRWEARKFRPTPADPVKTPFEMDHLLFWAEPFYEEKYAYWEIQEGIPYPVEFFSLMAPLNPSRIQSTVHI
jgi:hypothetical protein